MSNKKCVSINFVGCWNGFNLLDNVYINTLRKKFAVVLSDDPDFVFCFNYGNPFEYINYKCPRILICEEPITPDFTHFDYAIGFDYLTLDCDRGDRYLRCPFPFFYDDILALDHRSTVVESTKTKFCAFLYGHPSAEGDRERMLEEITKYKRVDSAGSYLNNMSDTMIRFPSFHAKAQFIKDYKFVIACESMPFPGFATEKIIHAFQARSIPVYFGDPFITRVFNPDAFIWCKDTNNMNDVLASISHIDNDEEAFLKMINAPIFQKGVSAKALHEAFESFLWHICGQEKRKAFRRQRYFTSEWVENDCADYRDYLEKCKSIEYRIAHRINALRKKKR